MRKIFGMLSWLLLLVAPFTLAQTREFNQTATLEAGGTLLFETDKGSVKLVAWEGREVIVSARIEAPENTDADYARRAIEGARVDISGDARTLSVRSNFDNVPNKNGNGNDGWGWSKSLPNIHYEIKAPRSLNLRLVADRSRVHVEGFTGKLVLEMDRSPLTARNLAGDVQIKVDRGEVRLEAVRGSLALNTDRTNTRAEALAIERDSRINISRGEAELRMPAAQAFSVSARTGRRESFETEFNITSRSFGRDLIEGTINGGGPLLAVEGDRSKIFLRKQ